MGEDKKQLEPTAGQLEKKRRKLILIADEEEVTGLEVRTCLEKWYDVVQVQSCYAALAFMENQLPDVLLADMEMEIHRELRKRKSLKGVPFFYFIYERDQIMMLRVRSTGAKGFIVKPIQKDELLSEISKVLGTPEVSSPEKEADGGKMETSAQNKMIFSKIEKPHVLVVDDFSIALKTMKLQLEGEYHVTLAISGKQALAILEKHRPDLIFMDVEMPEMDGIETVRKIKENPLWDSIPIIFLTGNKEKDTICSCRNLGAVDYMIKPVSLPRMKEKIRNVLGLS